MGIVDRRRRALRALRISVTDRCNLRCSYCMPEEEYRWLPKADLLRFEEIAELTAAFADVGVQKVRLTGGEPLLRQQLPRLIDLLAADGRLIDLALTTNGILLADRAVELKSAGLGRVTVSLDTLRRDRFLALARRDALAEVLRGIEAARAAGFSPLKLDSVMIRGTNDDELIPLLEYARGIGAEVRFIEYMDVGGATRWRMSEVFSRAEMLAAIEARFGPVQSIAAEPGAPAERFRLADGTTFGIIASTTQPFCGTCDRLRLTADGQLFTCLYATRGIDLRSPIRSGEDRAQLCERIAASWRERDDAGAEERIQLRDRGALVKIGALKQDPHLEMHTRGG